MSATGSTRLGRYEILARIGAGGMGEVYKARDERLSRFVALKVLPAGHLSDTVHRQRLIQEAQAASALNNAHIITVHDVGSENGRDYIVMEFVPGKTLDALIPRSGMRLPELLKIAIQIANGLSAAHAAGIVHRDLKPSNIIVSEAGLVKVLDFGLAKSVEVSGENSNVTTKPITKEGTVVGTVAYMSPEQAEGRALDARSDIFSFGSVLYEMATGRRAFHGSSPASTMADILTGEPQPVHEAAPGLPDELVRIISQCLRKDPGKRLQHMADLEVRLEDLLAESESGTQMGKYPAKKKWRPRLAVAAALSVLAAAGVGLWFSRTRPEPPQRVVPLTTFAGNENFPSFSPDGNQVAFAWNGERQDNFDIYVKFVGSATALRLTSDPAPEVFPSWSPDGRQIAFVKIEQMPVVYSVSPLGGSPQKIADFAAGRATPSWSPDGRFLVVTKSYAGKPEPGAGSIYALPLEGGEPRLLLAPEYGHWYAEPAVAPDGGSLAFRSCTGAIIGAGCDIYVMALKAGLVPSGSGRRVVVGTECCYGLTWTADGRSLLYGRGGVESRPYLWRVGVKDGGAPQRLEIASERAANPAVSRSANRLAFARSSREDQIWRFDVGGKPKPFLMSSAVDGNPEFSPDGRRIAFTSTRGLEGGTGVWLARSDGTDLVQLTRGPQLQGSPSWSPDGRWIAFDTQDANGKWQLEVVDSSGGHPRPLTSGQADNAGPRWSRDGKRIYFGSDRTGRYEIWRISAQGGEPEQITRNGGYVASESADGRALYYVKGSIGPIYSRSLAGGEEKEVTVGILNRNFVVFEDGIYYIDRGSPSNLEIRFHDFLTGRSRLVSRVKGPLTLGFSVSPDRKTFLFTKVIVAGTDLMLIENFR